MDTRSPDHRHESESGLRAAFARLFATDAGAPGPRLLIGRIDSPLGPLVAGSTDEGICLLAFTDRRTIEAQCQTLQRRFGRPAVPGEDQRLERLRVELAEYFAGRRREFSVPAASPGTSFQMRVWEALRAIPYGQTRSYRQLAEAVGSPGACRAVGAANGANRVAILIPCHRVVNADGRLGGYADGLHRKQALLELERRSR